MEVAGHKFRDFRGVDAVFGANANDYPEFSSMPEDYRKLRAEGCKIFSALFFNGGTLADHGRVLRDGVDELKFYTTLRALMGSFAPKHEVKEATCGLLIDEYTENTQ